MLDKFESFLGFQEIVGWRCTSPVRHHLCLTREDLTHAQRSNCLAGLEA